MAFSSAAVWFEIPVLDLARAIQFYEQIFQVQLRQEDMGGTVLAVFPKQDNEAGGCLMLHPTIKPAGESRGTVVYMNANPSLSDVLARVESAGGKILVPAQVLPGDMGAFAHIGDTEGNLVGLHAFKI